jgi:mono/diheme cytochrome c family protein
MQWRPDARCGGTSRDRPREVWQKAGMRSVVLLLVAATACSSTADLKDGKQVYDMVCVTCHGPTGTPDATMVAKLGVKDLRSPELRAKITTFMVENQVKHGSQNKQMPAFAGALSDVQIKAVADYVASAAFLDKH